MRFWRTLHKWLGLLVFLQVLVWMGSGFLISLFDNEIAAGRSTLAATDPAPVNGRGVLAFADLPIEPGELRGIDLYRVDDRSVYRVQYREKVSLLDARSGEVFTVDASAASRIAQASYAGKGNVTGARRLDNPAALKKFEGSTWEVAFDDRLRTRVYIDTTDGRVLGHRNDRSALQAFLLKLHFMDYSAGTDFNHPLIILFAVVTLWLAISGVLLLVSSLRRVGLR